jgi:hypothetical protein
MVVLSGFRQGENRALLSLSLVFRAGEGLGTKICCQPC